MEEQEQVFINLYHVVDRIYGLTPQNSQILIDGGKVEIDDTLYTGDRTRVPLGEIDGKRVFVGGPIQGIRFTYRHKDFTDEDTPFAF